MKIPHKNSRAARGGTDSLYEKADSPGKNEVKTTFPQGKLKNFQKSPCNGENICNTSSHKEISIHG